MTDAGNGEAPRTDGHVHLFVGGLHRSGTSIVMRALAEHPEISGFSGTGVPEDEGQHLQSVIPSGRPHGRAGRFALEPEAHLTEESPLATAANGQRMFEQWAQHWDLSRPVLLEKSPPNLIRSRFLQALFPQSFFVMVVRHPAAVTLATAKWASIDAIDGLLAHWVAAHETLASDMPHVRRLMILRYENFVDDPRGALEPVLGALGLEPHTPQLKVKANGNRAYFRSWRRSRNPFWARPRPRPVDEFEPLVQPFGYSLRDLDLVGPWTARNTGEPASGAAAREGA